MRLISPDHQQILLNKTFDHIYHCGQGTKYPDHFGFICRDRESNAVTAESYVGFIFRCQAANLVKEILHSLQQAFQNAQATFKKRQQKGSVAQLCESCPMHWYHRLCCDLEGLDAEKTWVYLMKSVQSGLNEDEKDDVMTRYASAKTYSTEDQNDLFMTILRNLCEKNQRRHRHSGSEEKDPHFLERKSSSIDTFRAKVNNSFENLLKVT